MDLAIGLVLAVSISSAAYAARRLTSGGAVAAALMGTLVYALGGWRAAIILMTFFVSSSLLELLTRAAKRQPSGVYAKGGRRDAGQVLANGVVGAAFLALAQLLPEVRWPWFGFVGSMAAVTADTWATELGVLSRSPPRLITHPGRVVRPGTSGGITLTGSLVAGLGAVLIGLLGGYLISPPSGITVLLAAFGGITGSVIDSVLGATVQAMYVCDRDGVETEQHPVHSCGASTRHLRGWHWLNNDWVNAACAATGAVLASAMGIALGVG